MWTKHTSNKKYVYILTTLIICTIFLSVCALKGIYPFGSNTLDTSDFEQQSVPIYYHMWDFLHGKSALLFDWNIGGGTNFAGVSSHFSLISPFSLFFLFIKRSWIEPSMTIYVLIKLVAMGLSMCFFLRNFWKDTEVKLEQKWQVMGSAAYALSGFTFQYYGFSWLDAAVVFPLLIYHFIWMARREQTWRAGKHAIGYLVCLALIFIMNIPQAYMTCFYLIAAAGGYFFIWREGDGKIKYGAILKFGLMTLLALGTAAIVFLPAAIHILTSSRMSNPDYSGISGYFLLLRQSGVDAHAKWIMMLGIIIPLGYLLSNIKKSRRHLYQCYLVFIIAIPVLFESVNILWHKDTYVCFPMRYAYMLIFTVIAVAAARKGEQGESQNRREISVPMLAAMILYMLAFAALFYVNHFYQEIGVISCFVILFSAVFAWVFRYQKKHNAQSRTDTDYFGYTVLAVWGITTIIMGTRLLIPRVPDKDINFVSDAEEVRDGLGESSDIFHKVKVADASINSNYPLILRSPSFSNYVHLMSAEQIQTDRALGYSQVWTRLSDTGGTLFSDALLGYTTTIHSAIPKNQGWKKNTEDFQLYEAVRETAHFQIYRNKYVYPAGLRVDAEEFHSVAPNYDANLFEHQNDLSELFFGEKFLKTRAESFVERAGEHELNYEISVEGKGILYLYTNEIANMEVYVDETLIPVPGFENITGSVYPAYQNNGMLSLGAYENQTVQIRLKYDAAEDGKEKHVYFGLLNLEKFQESANQSNGDGNPADQIKIGKSNLSFECSSQGKEYLYLPVYADDGWTCTVNKTTVEIEKLLGTFIMIPLQEGSNRIELTYMPRGYKQGIFVTVMAVVLAGIWIAASKLVKKGALLDKIYLTVSWAAMAIFVAVYVGFMLLVYMIPIIYECYIKILGCLGL